MGDHAPDGREALTGPAPATAEPGADALDAGRRLFARECRFVAAATQAEALPPTGLPEVAFAGRSNVGKSSLLNALTGQRALARVSRTPGRTQQINFFELGQRLVLVDLPGYGYAAVARARVREWTRLFEDYLKGRPTLRRLCLLIDSRHGAKDSDRTLMALMDEAAVSYQIVLTKADLTPADEIDARRAALLGELAGHGAAHPEIMAASARTGAGIAGLRAALAALAAPERFD